MYHISIPLVNAVIASPSYDNSIPVCTHLVVERAGRVQMPRRGQGDFHQKPGMVTIINKSGGAIDIMQPPDPSASAVLCSDGERRKPVCGPKLGTLTDDGRHSSWVEIVDSGVQETPWIVLRHSDYFTAAEVSNA